MTSLQLALIFSAIGVILLIAEVFIPSHATLSVLGAVSLLAAVICCFTISSRLGFISLAGVIIASPIVILLMLNLWPKTLLGRRMTLEGVASSNATAPAATTPNLAPGQAGTTLTALRPTGIVSFQGHRVEARSDAGILPPDTQVIITAVTNNRPTVRPLRATDPAPAASQT